MTKIDKGKVLQVLRQRGLDARADWVDREFPEQLDSVKNASLFRTLGLKVAEFASSEDANAELTDASLADKRVN